MGWLASMTWLVCCSGAAANPSAVEGVLYRGKSLNTWLQVFEAGGEPGTRAEASLALSGIGQPAVEPLIRMLSREETPPALVPRIVSILGRIGPDAKVAVPHLLRYCGSEDQSLRGESAVALARITPEHAGFATAILIDVLDREGEAAADAAFAIAAMGPRLDAAPAVGVLTKLLSSRASRERLAAAYALGRIGPAARAAIPALTVALQDSDKAVAHNARVALQSLERPR